MICPKCGSEYQGNQCPNGCNTCLLYTSIVRMEVPCCGGLENATKTALQRSGKFIPWQVVTISTDGRILS